MNTDIKTLASFPGYGVSADGRVWSLPRYGRRRVQQLRPQPNQDGYPTVTMRCHKKSVKQTVHKFVALAFIGPPPSPDHEVRHLNGDINDPRADNLAWGTRKDNADDRARHGRTARGSKIGISRLCDADVVAIRIRVASGETRRSVAKAFRISDVSVSHICNGRTWSHLPNPVLFGTPAA